jgi:hypothetical protein
MRKDAVLDFFAVVRNVGLAIAVAGFLTGVIGFVLLLAGQSPFGMILTTPGIALLLSGLLLALVARISGRLTLATSFRGERGLGEREAP